MKISGNSKVLKHIDENMWAYDHIEKYKIEPFIKKGAITMTLDEQIEILQAAKNGEIIQYWYAENWIDIGSEYIKNYKFNFENCLYRIKPKEPEQPDIIKTEIKWNEEGFRTTGPLDDDILSWEAGDGFNGYRMVGFEYDHEEIKSVIHKNDDPFVYKYYSGPIRPLFCPAKQDYVFIKSTHAIWQKEE